MFMSSPKAFKLRWVKAFWQYSWQKTAVNGRLNISKIVRNVSLDYPIYFSPVWYTLHIPGRPLIWRSDPPHACTSNPMTNNMGDWMGWLAYAHALINELWYRAPKLGQWLLMCASVIIFGCKGGCKWWNSFQLHIFTPKWAVFSNFNLFEVKSYTRNEQIIAENELANDNTRWSAEGRELELVAEILCGRWWLNFSPIRLVKKCIFAF